MYNRTLSQPRYLILPNITHYIRYMFYVRRIKVRDLRPLLQLCYSFLYPDYGC